MQDGTRERSLAGKRKDPLLLAIAPAPTRPAVRPTRYALARQSVAGRSGSGGGYALRPGRLGVDVVENIFRQEPFTNRGIRKHTGDAVKNWFRLVEPGTSEDHALNAEFQAWARRVRLKRKMVSAMISAHLYGDGVLELESDRKLAPLEATPEGARVVDVHVVDAARIAFKEYRENPDAPLRHALAQRTLDGVEIQLHPDRFEHLRITELPGFVHGLSTVELAAYSALGKIRGEQGLGEILYRAGVPLRHAAVDGEQEAIDDVVDLVSDPNFQHWLVTGAKVKVEQLNPGILDPTPFGVFWQQSIAASIGIPYMILVGAQAGAVAGSEVNLDEYHGDLGGVQENVLDPATERIVRGVTGLEADEFEIAWNAFPQSLATESVSIRERVTAFNLLTAAGVSPVAAARECRLNFRAEDFAAATPPGFLPARPPQRKEEIGGVEDDDDEVDGGGGQ